MSGCCFCYCAFLRCFSYFNARIALFVAGCANQTHPQPETLIEAVDDCACRLFRGPCFLFMSHRNLASLSRVASCGVKPETRPAVRVPQPLAARLGSRALSKQNQIQSCSQLWIIALSKLIHEMAR